MRLEQYGVRNSSHVDLGWVDGCTFALLEEEWDARRSAEDEVERQAVE